MSLIAVANGLQHEFARIGVDIDPEVVLRWYDGSRFLTEMHNLNVWGSVKDRDYGLFDDYLVGDSFYGD